MRWIAAAAVLLAGAAQAQAQDAAPGRLLYETHCGACHYEKLHERPRSRSLVKSLADLRDQVARWAPQTGRRFTLEEREQIVRYLNASHYKLEK